MRLTLYLCAISLFQFNTEAYKFLFFIFRILLLLHLQERGFYRKEKIYLVLQYVLYTHKLPRLCLFLLSNQKNLLILLQYVLYTHKLPRLCLFLLSNQKNLLYLLILTLPYYAWMKLLTVFCEELINILN